MVRQGAIKDWLTKIAECVGHGFHLGAIIGDRKVSLAESAEISIEDDSTGLLVTNELFLDIEPHQTHRKCAGVNELHEGWGDGTE